MATTIYEYTGKTTSPDLDQMTLDVGTSAMTDKAVTSMTWDEAAATLTVIWGTALSAGDKTILDGIVA